MTVNGCFIVGNDGDDPGVFEGLREFIERSELLEAQVTILTPFPGTPLLAACSPKAACSTTASGTSARCSIWSFQPKQMTPDELVDGHTWLMTQIYNKEQYTRRKRHYVNIMKELDLQWYAPERETLEFFQ